MRKLKNGDIGCESCTLWCHTKNHNHARDLKSNPDTFNVKQRVKKRLWRVI